MYVRNQVNFAKYSAWKILKSLQINPNQTEIETRNYSTSGSETAQERRNQ